METRILFGPSIQEWQFGNSVYLAHLIPYAIIFVNFLLFKLLRSLVNYIYVQHFHEQPPSRRGSASRGSWRRLAKLSIDELISTCELCADCAELNVVYERNGSLAYGACLFLLSFLWIEAFGEAHTTPGYLVEDYFFVGGNELLKRGETYARFLGQSLAMPLAWRFASFYWHYQLLGEHKSMLVTENCRSSLTTSTLNGFLIELGCCLICRLLELIGQRLLERRTFGQRLVSLVTSFVCTALVVLALELSGGYFNPILASSLEYGCRGASTTQHALVFWLGPLLGHLLARGLYRRYGSELRAPRQHSGQQQQRQQQHQQQTRPQTPTQDARSSSKKSKSASDQAKRLTRANSKRDRN